MLKTCFASSAVLLSAITAHGQSPVQVDESKIRAVLRNDSTAVSISISSSADHAIKAGLSLAWLSTDDKDLDASRRDVELQPGQSEIEVPLPISSPSIWTRLRYTLVPDRAEARAFAPLSGVVSLSRITGHVFELKLNFAEMPAGGGRITVFGEAVHPVMREPVAGLEWNARPPCRKKGTGSGTGDRTLRVLYGRCIGSQGGTIEDRSTGRSVKTVNIPFDRLATDPILVDRSSFLSPGENQITLSPSAEMQNALVLVSATHWVPWEKTRIRSSPQLQLSARFDRLDVRAGDSVRCSVSARRVGFRGYGMMLAEIGLPPGTEVDRASLESVVEDASPGVDRYEVLPDRVVFCLGLRSPMKAKSAPSVLYDYYNPEALSEIPPFRWVVKN